MKKVNEVKKPIEKKAKKYFLYVDGKGFIRVPREAGTLPSFTDGEIICYTSRAKAIYAREFFIGIKMADSIDILSKVA